MRGYYVEKLSGERLRRCYDLAPPRVKQYLEAEIRFVLGRLKPDDAVLEIGCGYGRVTTRLTTVARRAVGIDVSAESLALARRLAPPGPRCEFLGMDALRLAFRESAFDTVVCIQNGVCAFGVDQTALLREASRVTRPGGHIFLSSYSEHFWPHRLAWFEAQAAAGLVGAIDYEHTRNGTIACTDGFRAGMMAPPALLALARRLRATAEVIEVDESAVFCDIVVASD